MKKRYGCVAILFSAMLVVCGCGHRESSSAALATDPVKVYIMSVTASPLFSESITIRNNSGEAVDVSRWTLGNFVSPTAYTVPDGNVLNQGDTKTFSHAVLGFQIADTGEILYLKNNAGALVDSWSN